MFIYSVDMRENAPEEAVIIVKIVDIKDPFTVWELGVSIKDPTSIVGRNVQRLIARLCTESNRYPLHTDKEFAA